MLSKTGGCADVEQNKANRKKADVAAIQQQEAAMGGGTMLAGTTGVTQIN